MCNVKKTRTAPLKRTEIGEMIYHVKEAGNPSGDETPAGTTMGALQPPRGIHVPDATTGSLETSDFRRRRLTLAIDQAAGEG